MSRPMNRRSAILAAAAAAAGVALNKVPLAGAADLAPEPVKIALPQLASPGPDSVYDRVLAELRRRLTQRLGPEFVESQDELIRGMADFTAKAVVRQPSTFDARHREAWMRYMVEEFFPAFPWAVGCGPGWDQVKDNPPKPAGWALAQLSGSAA